MPLSSAWSCCRKTPPQSLRGLRVNWQRSRRDGRLTEITGSPFWYTTVTSVIHEEDSQTISHKQKCEITHYGLPSASGNELLSSLPLWIYVEWKLIISFGISLGLLWIAGWTTSYNKKHQKTVVLCSPLSPEKISIILTEHAGLRPNSNPKCWRSSITKVTSQQQQLHGNHKITEGIFRD